MNIQLHGKKSKIVLVCLHDFIFNHRQILNLNDVQCFWFKINKWLIITIFIVNLRKGCTVLVLYKYIYIVFYFHIDQYYKYYLVVLHVEQIHISMNWIEIYFARAQRCVKIYGYNIIIFYSSLALWWITRI